MSRELLRRAALVGFMELDDSAAAESIMRILGLSSLAPEDVEHIAAARRSETTVALHSVVVQLTAGDTPAAGPTGLSLRSCLPS